MTAQPVPPGDTERLAKIAYDQLVHAWGLTWEQRGSSSVEKYRVVVRAVAAALVPEGFVAVRTDDLRDAKEAIEAYRASLDSAVQLDGDNSAWRTLIDLDVSGIIDRLRAALGEPE